MRVLVTGAGGLVGRAVIEHCQAQDDEVLGYDHLGLDVADPARVNDVIERDRPDLVINCAAWTDVDGCENAPQQAHAINAAGPENLARASRSAGGLFVTISTDYVFDGHKAGFYTQRDHPNPESVYGLSKLEGERRAQLAYARTIVVRTGFVFGPGGKNFLSTVVDRARRGEQLKAIGNAWGTPTYSRDLAARLRVLANLDLPGVFHVVNAGAGVSYEEFARLALRAAGCEHANLETVTTESLHRPARRPRNARLQCVLSEALGLPALPFWGQAVQTFVASQQPEIAPPKLDT